MKHSFLSLRTLECWFSNQRLTDEEFLEEYSQICLCGPPIVVNPELLDFIIVLRLPIPELRQRLGERQYSQQKIEENVEAEIMGIILLDSQEIPGQTP